MHPIHGRKPAVAGSAWGNVPPVGFGMDMPAFNAAPALVARSSLRGRPAAKAVASCRGRRGAGSLRPHPWRSRECHPSFGWRLATRTGCCVGASGADFACVGQDRYRQAWHRIVVAAIGGDPGCAFQQRIAREGQVAHTRAACGGPSRLPRLERPGNPLGLLAGRPSARRGGPLARRHLHAAVSLAAPDAFCGHQAM